MGSRDGRRARQKRHKRNSWRQSFERHAEILKDEVVLRMGAEVRVEKLRRELATALRPLIGATAVFTIQERTLPSRDANGATRRLLMEIVRYQVVGGQLQQLGEIRACEQVVAEDAIRGSIMDLVQNARYLSLRELTSDWIQRTRAPAPGKV